ncbi:MAG: type secretion protein [Rhodocyclales bacterium]|nr:type secretion protein [Rhodocyclales bacterium]
MGATVRTKTDHLADSQALFDALEKKPYSYDFFQAMRKLECHFPDKPRWGMALRPADEPIRLGQEPSMSFAPASLSAFVREGSAPPRLEVRFFGLLGPNGPLPLHLTEYARHRLMHVGDATFARFLDIIHHRFLSLFYRSWAQAQPTVNLDRRADDRFAVYVGALVGHGMPSLRQRDAIPDNAKMFHAGALGRQVRNADGLAAILTEFFKLPISVEQYVGHWMALPESEQSQLRNNQLGRTTVIGKRVWDRQGKFRLHIGPLTWQQFEDFLPTGKALPALLDWVRLYTNGELFWDARLLLKREELPATKLAKSGRLGWTSRLGKRTQAGDAGELILDVERLLKRQDSSMQAA